MICGSHRRHSNRSERCPRRGGDAYDCSRRQRCGLASLPARGRGCDGGVGAAGNPTEGERLV
eukprot:5643762-Prymnesium_polylepis.2